MNIWSYLFSTINFNFFLFNALNVIALTVTSSLILGEKPQTFRSYDKISNSFLCDNKILSVTIFTLLYKRWDAILTFHELFSFFYSIY